MSDEERKAKRLMKAKKLEDSDEVGRNNVPMYQWFHVAKNSTFHEC